MKKLIGYKNSNAFNRKNLAQFPPSYPNEMMVKLLSSNIYSNLIKKFYFLKNKKKILEVGSSSGNNLRFFIENKLDCFGIEINHDMVNLGKDNLKRLGYKIPEIKIGHNTKIPYPDNFFDCLI
ncbi:class I SAM-dependent methyltransferase, partial [Candidatus Pelagibacter sp.]|nr:class I SAM-dependent methyltransferase [Candidatus Pelagibacter sp.]